MTIRHKRRRCRYCNKLFTPPPKPGRATEYCKPSHRQREYERRNKIRRFDRVEVNGKFVAL